MDINLLDAEQSFIDAIRDAGLTPPDQIIFDDQIHRFDSDDKRDKTGWYVAYADGYSAGAFGCWRARFKQNWSYYKGKDLSDAERSVIDVAHKKAK